MSDTAKEVEVRDERGRLTGRFQLAEGQLHGLSTLYNLGRVVAEIHYEHGLRQGEMCSYGESGQPSAIIPHANDLPHGEATFYDPDGALARIANYKDGRLHGEVRDFAPDGRQIDCSTYIEGKKQDAGATAPVTAKDNAKAGQGKSWLARLVEG